MIYKTRNNKVLKHTDCKSARAFEGNRLMKGFLTGLTTLILSTGAFAQKTVHAVDSVGIGNKGLKLMVAGDNPTSFKHIMGFFYDPAATNVAKQKRAVDVVEFDPNINKIVLQYRGGTEQALVSPSPTIKAYLQGNGSVPMAPDSNIKIVGRIF